MASSNKTFHARSISLPTTSYPLTLVVEEQLCRLRSSELATSSSSISNNLAGLKDLYESVEDLLSNHDVKCLDTVLDGSITLLDVCSTIKDVLSQMKQSVQDLQSSTRKCSIEIDTYMTSRKKVAKVIRKCLTDLKRTANKKNDLVADVSLLKKVEATTLEVFESILSFVSEPKQNRSLISKLMSDCSCGVHPNKHLAPIVDGNTLLLISSKSIQLAAFCLQDKARSASVSFILITTCIGWFCVNPKTFPFPLLVENKP